MMGFNAFPREFQSALQVGRELLICILQFFRRDPQPGISQIDLVETLREFEQSRIASVPHLRENVAHGVLDVQGLIAPRRNDGIRSFLRNRNQSSGEAVPR